MAFTLGFLSLFGFLGVAVPLADDSDKLLFGLAGSSDSLLRTSVSESPSTDLSTISVVDRESVAGMAVMVVTVATAVEVITLLADDVVTEVRLPSRDSIIVTEGEPEMAGSATTNLSVL